MKEMINEMFMGCVLEAEFIGYDEALFENGEGDEISIKRRRSRLRGMMKMLKIACNYTDTDYYELKSQIREARSNSFTNKYEELTKFR